MTQVSPKNKQVILHAAIAAAFGMAASQAGAVLKVASEIPSTTTGFAAGANLNLTLTPQAGIAPSNASPYYIKVGLSGATKFASTPVVYCNGVTGNDSASSVLFTGSLQAGGAGFAYASFQLTAGVTGTIAGMGAAASAGSFITGTCTASGFGITGVTVGTSITYTATNEYKVGAAYTTSISSDIAYITFTTGVVAAASAASAVIVDATTGSQLWATGSDLQANAGATSPSPTAYMGHFIVTAIGTSAVTATLVANASADDVFSGTVVTVSGAPIAAALAKNGSAGVFLATGVGCNIAMITGAFGASANAGTTVTFTAVTTATISNSGVNLCVNVSGISAGSTTISTGDVYMYMSGTQAANVTATLIGAAKKVATVTSNGITRNAYIVHAPTSTAKTTTVWVKNTGATAGPVYITCTKADGTTAGTASSVLVANLTASQLIYKSSSDIFTTIGYTSGYAATDKISCILNAAMAAMEVINTTRDVATGAITLTQAQTN